MLLPCSRCSSERLLRWPRGVLLAAWLFSLCCFVQGPRIAESGKHSSQCATFAMLAGSAGYRGRGVRTYSVKVTAFTLSSLLLGFQAKELLETQDPLPPALACSEMQKVVASP